jgi:hypothetical protein
MVRSILLSFLSLPQGLNHIKVRVTNVAVEHEVRIMDFTEMVGAGWRTTTRNDGSQMHSVDSWDG